VVPEPPSEFRTPSTIVSWSTRLRPIVPSPIPVRERVTVRVVPLPETERVSRPEITPGTATRSAASTPVTVSLNVTVQQMLVEASSGSSRRG